MEELESDKIESLLNEIKTVRDSVGVMISDLETLSKKIDTLFPDELSYKSRWVFEEKVKATTEMFKALLEMRKEVTKSLKDEIEIRRKIINKDTDDLEDLFDIRKLAKRVNAFQKTLDSKENNLEIVSSNEKLLEEKEKYLALQSGEKS
jgi:hypothetical protein